MNKHSTIGKAEELINILLNAIATENHARINYEYYWSSLNIKQLDDIQLEEEYKHKLELEKEILIKATEFRRNVMTALFNLGDGNHKQWCTLKHMAEVLESSFETWQTDLSNKEYERLYHSSVELFNLVISDFLGFEPVACSACLADAMKSQEEFEDIVSKKDSKDKTIDDVLKEADKVFKTNINDITKD